MLYNNEDEFLKLLANKISQVTPKQPTNGDWDSFDKAYLAHKQSNKKRIFIWFSVLSVSLFGFYAIYLNANTDLKISGVKKIVRKEMVNNEIANAPLAIAQKPKTSITTMANNSIKIQTNNNLLVVNALEIKIIQKNKVANKKGFVANELNVPIVNVSIENNSIELIKKWSSVIALNSGNYVHNIRDPEYIIIGNGGVFGNKFNSANINLEKSKAIKTKGKLKANLAYFELGYLMQSNVYKQLNNSTGQYFNGISANSGLKLNNNWSLNFGLSALFLNQTEINKSIFESAEKQIDRIDTTIKYNAFYKRLMMQIDTVTSQKNVAHQTYNMYRNNVAFYNLPIQARYQLGNKKRSFYAAFGVTGTVVYQQETNAKNVGLVNETSTTNNNYQVLFAPSLGVGAHQKIYNNWAFHVSANYLKYLNSSFYQPNTFQLQTGLQYNF